MLVSILIPCYNAERWIGACIESALAQTWPEKEVIVVDDGSTDGSLRVIESFGDRIRFETGPNRGGNAARNRLLELSGGEWLQYLDADDYLLPEKISKQVEFIRVDPNSDIVFSPVTIEHWNDGTSRRELLPISEPHDPWILLARWYLPQTGAPLWRKQSIVDAGGWKKDQACCQEHELYLRLLMERKSFTYCDFNGAVYRQWGEHTTCKRDTREVRRRRLDIEKQAEDFLLECGELTLDRLWAINQARFEMARMAWLSDHQEALEIVAKIQESQYDFQPGGTAAPAHYRIVWKWLGFQRTEMIAGWFRKLRRLVAV